MRDLLRIVRLSNRYKDHFTEGLDITGKHCKYIMCICNHEGMTQEEIASHLNVDKSNAARRLSEMEAKGYIVRKVKKEDKRNREIYPTEKAYKAYPYIKNLIISWNEYVTEDLTCEEKELFEKVIGKMKEKANSWPEHDFSLPPFPKEMIK